jgi:hypothetical protein
LIRGRIMAARTTKRAKGCSPVRGAGQRDGRGTGCRRCCMAATSVSIAAWCSGVNSARSKCSSVSTISVSSSESLGIQDPASTSSVRLFMIPWIRVLSSDGIGAALLCRSLSMRRVAPSKRSRSQKKQSPALSVTSETSSEAPMVAGVGDGRRWEDWLGWT